MTAEGLKRTKKAGLLGGDVERVRKDRRRRGGDESCGGSRNVKGISRGLGGGDVGCQKWGAGVLYWGGRIRARGRKLRDVGLIVRVDDGGASPNVVACGPICHNCCICEA